MPSAELQASALLTIATGQRLPGRLRVGQNVLYLLEVTMPTEAPPGMAQAIGGPARRPGAHRRGETL